MHYKCYLVNKDIQHTVKNVFVHLLLKYFY